MFAFLFSPLAEKCAQISQIVLFHQVRQVHVFYDTLPSHVCTASKCKKNEKTCLKLFLKRQKILKNILIKPNVGIEIHTQVIPRTVVVYDSITYLDF